MTGTPIAKRAEVALRRSQAIDMANAGAGWDEIAEALGYASRGAAHTDVQRALDAYVRAQQEAAETLRARELANLAGLEAKVLEVLHRRHLVVQNGKVVRDIDGDTGELIPVQDDGPTLAAIDRLLKIAERRAKLLGLDAPMQVAGNIEVAYNIVGVDLGALR